MDLNGEKVIIFWSQSLDAPDYTYVVCVTSPLYGFSGEGFGQREGLPMEVLPCQSHIGCCFITVFIKNSTFLVAFLVFVLIMFLFFSLTRKCVGIKYV